jgi:hypothetical protein
MQLDGVAPVFCLGIGLHGFIFKWKFGLPTLGGTEMEPQADSDDVSYRRLLPSTSC